MDKQILLGRYQSARSTLLVATILTAINTILLLVGLDYYLIYSLSIPVIAVALANALYTGVTGILIIIMFAIIPVILLIISYLLSKKDYKWLTVATVIFVIDLLLVVGYEFLLADASMVIDIVIKCMILFMMFAGVKAGKQLNNNFDVSQAEVKEAEENVKMYRYDDMLAKQNKTNKMWLFFLATFGWLFAVILLTTIITLVSDNIVAVIFVVLLAVAIFVCWLLFIIKISPFVDCRHVCYYSDNGIVARLSSGSMISKTVMSNLLLEEEKDNCYICSYISTEGRTKRIVIPKCYKDIEEIFQ